MDKRELVDMLYSLRRSVDAALRIALELPEICTHGRIRELTTLGASERTLLCRDCGERLTRPLVWQDGDSTGEEERPGDSIQGQEEGQKGEEGEVTGGEVRDG